MATYQDTNLRFAATINKNNSDFITDEPNPLFQSLANNNYFSYTGIREIFSPTVILADDDSVFSNIPKQPIISNHSLHNHAA